MQYQAVLFDYDGTLTARYTHTIPQDLVGRIVELNERGVMMGLCTARNFGAAFDRIDVFADASSQPDLVRQNWVMICENGSKGYYFNAEKGDYEEFYSVSWPKPIDREALYDVLCREFGGHCDILNNDISFEVFVSESEIEGEGAPTKVAEIESDIEKNDISMILRPTGREQMTHAKWEEASRKIYHKVIEILEKFDPNGLLHIGDSKMGVSILSAVGDKDRGIAEFAKFLGERHGLEIAAPYREILAIGDQANEGGNDYYFLKGEVGTSFTVGEEMSKSSNAKQVLNDAGEVLRGPHGTLEVLNKAF